jgi:NADH:ubiquinone oxidoreductase subunit F (NADH-binding)
MSTPPQTLSDTALAGDSRRVPNLPRLLEGIPSHGAMSLAEHLAVHGPLPLIRKPKRGAEHPLIEQIEQAGLRGHGGAGFPTARKLRTVAASRRRAVVVVNAAEGEPASLKDRTLTQTLPHLVLDGAVLAAQMVGADEVIVSVCESARNSIESLAEATAQRGSPERGPARIRLVTVPDRYLTGQESALVNHLNGGPAIPTFTPPMPFQQGVARRPTLVNNAETLAHVALIARHGPDWFRELGTSSQPGSTLVTLSGPVAYPGVYEIEYGASLSSLISAAGGCTSRLHGVLLGGYGGSWIGEAYLHELVLSDAQLASYGASLGAGVVLLLSEHACPVAETSRVVRWLAQENAGQCGPCIHGLDAIATTFQEMAGGTAHVQATERIARLAELLRSRGACGHPDGAVRLILSAIESFGPELADHARHGPCEGCRSPGELPLPTSRPYKTSTFSGYPGKRNLERELHA